MRSERARTDILLTQEGRASQSLGNEFDSPAGT